MSETQRRYVYGIVAALGALALFYGLVTAESLPLWLALTAAVLGNGLAFANTTKKTTGGRHEKKDDDPSR
ncbi:hypothetical protein [Arthrobacter sp. GMC3]|uniref:phage holin n=1 Tax=Arthrobacter sp. GMC3 TaxID=2058894 RepID=UPI001CA51DD5|nr:hypothetical protein [Arthrobacter sp. GMC3]